MTASELKTAVAEKSPLTNPSEIEQCLWLAGTGDWHGAHDIAQDLPDPEGGWLHAHLHRQEGDLGNAAYWYSRVNQPMPVDSVTIEQEWAELVDALLS